jgi:hypothetical protein
MGFLRDAKEWYRTQCEIDRIQNPLRIRQKLKELWPWYVPAYLLPIAFVSEWALGIISSRARLIGHGVIPFVLTMLLFVIHSTRIELSKKETLFFFYILPFSIFLAACIVWALIHDTFMK